MSDLYFRLRIRNAADSADALTITSVRGGTNPYLASPPYGDGQELDPLTGQLRTGSYRVQVVDAVTGTDGTGTVRVFTNALYDSVGRMTLLSRRAFLESSPDGSTWNAYYGGYITGIRQGDAVTYDVELGDTRRVERNHRIFTWSNEEKVPGAPTERSLFPQRACLIGGPIIGGWGNLADSGGWEFIVASTAADGVTLALNFVAAYVPPNFSRQREYGSGDGSVAVYAARVIQPFAEPEVFSPFAPINLVNGQPQAYNALTVILTDGTTTWYGTLLNGAFRTFYVRLDGATAAPPNGTAVRLRIVQTEVSPACPLYFDRHPVELVTDLYDTVGIEYDAASATAVTEALGETLRYACRITEPQPMQEWLENSVFGPFGFAVRMNADGIYEFTMVRRLNTAAPSVTIATADLVSDALPPVFEVAESSVVTAFRYRYPVYGRNTQAISATPLPPADNVVVSEAELVYQNGDTSVFSTREVGYTFAGVVHDTRGIIAAFQQFINGVNAEGFNRFGRGAPEGEVRVIRGTSCDGLYPGDEVLVNVAHYPNLNYRIGESSVGPRIMQVIRRTDEPEAVVYRLADVGSNLQPASPAPTISIAPSANFPDTIAQFTITNAAAINATGVLVTAIEWRATNTGNGGVLFTRYAAGDVPTTAVLLPAVAPGSTVQVRVRTEQPGRARASAWTAWQSVTLTALTAPSAVTIGTPTAESFPVSWTNGETGYPVQVYAAPGAVAPSDWTPWLVQTFPPGSTQTEVRGLAASTAYIIGVAHVDPASGIRTTVATDTDTTAASNAFGAQLPHRLLSIPLTQDAQYPTGIALGLYAANSSWPIEIQRAPDVAGSPGTWATIAIVPGSQEVYEDLLPSDGATRWYRCRHLIPGLTPSGWTPEEVNAVPGNIPLGLLRPPYITAWLDITETPGSPDYEYAWDGYPTPITVLVDDGVSPITESPPSTNPYVVTRTTRMQTVLWSATGRAGDIATQTFTVPPLDASIDSVLVTRLSGTSFEVDWAVSNMPSGTTYDIAYNITDDGSGSGVVTGATDPETITGVTLGTAPSATVTVTARTSGGSLLDSFTTSGPMIL